MKSKNKIGICGLGNMGSKHLKVYKSNNNAQVDSVFDPEHINKKYTNYNSFLDSCKNLDGVSICSPSGTHAKTALDILKINPKIKLLIEKPIDSSLDLAKKLLPYKKNIFVGHIERYNPVVLKIKEVIKDKKILTFSIKRLGIHQPTIKNDSVVLDLMIHDIDIVRFLWKGLNQEQKTKKIFKEKNNIVYALASFLYNDIYFLLESSWISPQKLRQIKILTPESLYSGDLITQTLTKESRFGMKENIRIKKLEPLKEEIFNFIKFINNEPHEKCTLEESIKNLETICEYE